MSNTATCPHCKKLCTDLWESGIQEGQTKEINCGHCGKDFEVKCTDKEFGVYEAVEKAPKKKKVKAK